MLSLFACVISATFSYQNLKDLVSNSANRYDSYLLADELRQSSDDLSRLVRTFVVTGDKRYEEQFFSVLAIRNGQAPRPKNYGNVYWDLYALADEVPERAGETVPLHELILATGITDQEKALLVEAQSQSDALVNLEAVAMRAANGRLAADDERYRRDQESDRDMAIRILHGPEYHEAKRRIMLPIHAFLERLAARTEAEFQNSA